MRSGSCGQTSAKRAIAASAAASASASAGKHWQNSDRTWRPGRRERRVGGGLAGGLDPWARRGPARRVRRRRRSRGRRACSRCRSSPPTARPRPAGEVGQAVEQQHDLDHGTCLAPAVRRRKTGERRRAQRVRVRQHGACAHLAAVLQHHARTRAPRRRARARPATRGAPARPPPRRPRAAPPSRRPCRRAHTPTPRARRLPRPGRGRRRRTRCPDRSVPRASRSGPGSRAARAPAPTGCRPGRRRSSRRAAPGRRPRAIAPRSGGSSISGRARAAAPSRRSLQAAYAVGVGPRPVPLELRPRALPA